MPSLLAIPKAELHCHLEGIADPGMVRIIRKNDPSYPIRPEDFEGLYPVDTFDGFINWWRVVQPVWGQFPPFVPLLLSYVRRAREENVRYLEVMISSSLIQEDPGMAVETMSSLRRLVDEIDSERIQVEFIACVPRHRPLEEIAPRAAIIHHLFERGLIAGVGLAGLEQGYPVKPLGRLFAGFHEAGMGIEIHAGEWCGPESVRDALDYGFPDRIGHGVSLFKDPDLLDKVLEREIHVEMCPTSNVKTGSVSRIEDHPVAIARERGMSFSISTDDPGIFENSMTSEFELLERVFGFTDEDFHGIFNNSIAARFKADLRYLSQV